MKIASDEQIDKKFHVFQKLSVLYVGPNISGKINYYFYSSLRSTSSNYLRVIMYWLEVRLLGVSSGSSFSTQSGPSLSL
jgi:hypothetical protein